jgi:hypothetical protein
MDAPTTEAKVAKADQRCRLKTDGKDEMLLPIRYTFLPQGGKIDALLKMEGKVRYG